MNLVQKLFSEFLKLVKGFRSERHQQNMTTHCPNNTHAQTPPKRTCAIETDTLQGLHQHITDTPPRHPQIITDTPPPSTKTQQETHTAQQHDKRDRPQRQCPDMSALHRHRVGSRGRSNNPTWREYCSA